MSSPAVIDELAPLHPEAARSAAGVLAVTAASAEEVAGAVVATRSAVPHWRGAALAAFSEAAVGIEEQIDLLVHTAGAGAALIAEYAVRLDERRTRMAALARAAEVVGARMQRVDDLARLAGDAAEAERLLQRRRALVAEQDAAAHDLARRLDALIADLPGRPRSWAEHVGDGVSAFLHEGVLQPAAAAGALAFGWVRDPRAWWTTVRGLPGAHLDALRHPARGAAEALQLEDFAAGRVGEGIGALAAAIAGRGVARAVEHAAPRQRPRGVPDPQTFDEMLAGVDLARHEGRHSGHALSRHVDVDDAYLRDRLTHGTLLPSGKRQVPAPSAASRWTDRETAELHVTRALRDHEDALRAAMRGAETRLELRTPVPATAGHVMTRQGAGFTSAPPTSACIVLVREGGHWILKTAYLEGAR